MTRVTYFKTEPVYNGTHTIIDFDNGYGVSIVEHDYSYGLQIAIRKDGSLCYDTPITDDVIGYCTNEKIAEVINQVQQLR